MQRSSFFAIAGSVLVMIAASKIATAEQVEMLELHMRSRKAADASAIASATVKWDPRKTSVVVVDM